MVLKVTMLDGPRAGRVFEFDDATELVEIGRDANHCQVIFPADYTVVGRRHAGIRRSLGSYQLDAKAHNPVLIDRREPFDGESLGPTQELQLGRGGPTILVETFNTSSLPVTDDIGRMRTASEVAVIHRNRIRQALGGLGFLLLVVVVGGGWLLHERELSSRQLELIAAQLRYLETQEIPSALLERVARSTYLVLLVDPEGSEYPIATAWALGPTVLATNAHVVDQLGESTETSLVVRSAVAPYPTVAIERVVKHPDYAEFMRAWDQFEPYRGLEYVDSPGAGYDVALMYVAEDTVLEPSLSIASEAALNSLTPGNRIAFVGFPMELLAAGGVNPSAPVPQVQVGNVTAVTDYFLLPAVAEERNLIQHSMPATGGASGSPVINADGYVVGVLSGGNVIGGLFGDRMPLAVGVNFAQRASLLHEIMDDVVGLSPERRRAAWETGFSTFDNPIETIPRSIYEAWRRNFSPNFEPLELFRAEGRLFLHQEGEDGAIGQYLTMFEGLISEPGDYLIIALSHEKHDIDVAAVVDGKLVARDESLDWYPTITLRHEGSAIDVLIYAVAESAPDFELRIWMLNPDSAGP